MYYVSLSYKSPSFSFNHKKISYLLCKLQYVSHTAPSGSHFIRSVDKFDRGTTQSFQIIDHLQGAYHGDAGKETPSLITVAGHLIFDTLDLYVTYGTLLGQQSHVTKGLRNLGLIF